MWKCSTKEGKSSCSCNPKITVLIGALVLIIIASVWLMASSGNAAMPTTGKTLIGIPTWTTDLSEADHKAALAQGTCPVMGTPLSETTTIHKINFDGREIFVCCEACVQRFEADPDRYLANLQGNCPVCGVNLVKVDEPAKTSFQGRDIYFHTEKCEQMFLTDPDKYLKNLQ